MPRNQNIFTDAPLWSHPKDNKQYFTVEEVPQALRELGIQHLHVDSASSTIKLVQKNWQRFQGGRHRRHLCYFSSDKRGSCKFAIRETCYDTQNGNSCFQVGNCVHGAHLAGAIVGAKMLIGSPSVLQKKPSAYIRSYVSKFPDLDYGQQKQAQRAFIRIKQKNSRKGVPEGISLLSRAAVYAVLQPCRFSVVAHLPDFDCDTVYLCQDRKGDSFILDEGPDDSAPAVVAVFSTEELLLNLYRQNTTGQDIHIQMDASYRYTTSRNCGYIPVKVSSLTQSGRTVAYAVVTKEDSDVHAFIVESVVTSLEAVVNRRILLGDQHV